MGKPRPENILNELEVHWDEVIVTSGTFEGLSVKEARDLNDEADKKKKPIDKIVQAYREKKEKAQEKTVEPEPALEPTPGPEKE